MSNGFFRSKLRRGNSVLFILFDIKLLQLLCVVFIQDFPDA